MTRRRWAATVVVGVLLGFFAGIAAVQLASSGTSSRVVAAVAPADAGAAAAALANVQSAQYGAKQAAVHLALVRTAPIVPFIRTLSSSRKSNAGCPCPTVFQLQRALKAAKYRTGASTGTYGAGTVAEVKAFQRHVKLPASGVYGEATHHQLSRYYDKAGRQRLQAVAHSRTVIAFRTRIIHATSVAWSHRSSMRYSQSASRGFLPSLPAVPVGTDCSGYTTWAFKVSGLPDPNGLGYSPVGYTGTLAQHGVRVSARGPLKVGDLVFYGGGWPYGHVAIVTNGFLRLVSSHGSPGIKVLRYDYRPVSAVRRYF